MLGCQKTRLVSYAGEIKLYVRTVYCSEMALERLYLPEKFLSLVCENVFTGFTFPSLEFSNN